MRIQPTSSSSSARKFWRAKVVSIVSFRFPNYLEDVSFGGTKSIVRIQKIHSGKIYFTFIDPKVFFVKSWHQPESRNILQTVEFSFRLKLDYELQFAFKLMNEGILPENGFIDLNNPEFVLQVLQRKKNKKNNNPKTITGGKFWWPKEEMIRQLLS